MTKEIITIVTITKVIMRISMNNNSDDDGNVDHTKR